MARTVRVEALAFGMHLKASSDQRSQDAFVLTNIIQAGVASSGSPSKSALPFPSLPDAGNFASTLQNLQAPGSPTSELQAAAVAERAKPPAKKMPESSTTRTAGQIMSPVVQAPVLTAVPDAKSSALIATNLAATPALLQSFAATSIDVPMSSGSGPMSDTAERPTGAGVPSRFRGRLQSRVIDTSATITSANANVAGASGGKSSPTGDPVLLTMPSTAKSSITLPVAVSGADVPTVNVDQSEPSIAGQEIAGHATGASFASRTSAMTAVSNRAVATTATQESLATIAKLSGATDTPQSSAPPPQNGVLAGAMSSGSTDAGVAAAVNQAAPKSNLQFGQADPQSGPTATQSALPADAIDVASIATTNVFSATKPMSGEAKLTSVSDDRGDPAAGPSATPFAAIDSGNRATLKLDNPAQPVSGPVSANVAELAASLTISNAAISSKATQPVSASAAGAKEIFPAGVWSTPAASNHLVSNEVANNQIASKQSSSNQNATKGAFSQISYGPATSNQLGSQAVLSNQESAKKPVDPLSHFPAINLQPLSANAVVSAPSALINDSSQPGTAPVTSVLPQAPAVSVPGPGNGNGVLPAANSPSPVTIPSLSSPQVGPVEAARLVTSVAQSEMHIGLRTQAFGSVEVHTVVRDSQVGLSVGSERGDLRSYLTTEVSGLQTAFRQQDLRFDNIRFLESSTGTSAGFSGGSNSQPHSSNQQQSPAAGFLSIHGPPEDVKDPELGASLTSRLNVHA